MSQTLAHTSGGDSLGPNNLDTLRLILALLVFFEHSNNLFHVALGQSDRSSFFLLNLSDVAVSGFFVLSGMLTYLSFARDRNLQRFYLRRGFRVLPAYLAVVLLQTAVLYLAFVSSAQNGELLSYLGANLLTANFLHPSFIDGIPSLNGSLWTIKIELAYYVILPFLFPLIARSWRWWAVFFVLSLLWALFFPSPLLSKQLPGKIFLFFIGVAVARKPSLQNPNLSYLALALMPFAIWAHQMAPAASLAEKLLTIMLSILLVVAFLKRWFDHELPDLSYTVYLVHYPILVLLTRTVLSGYTLPATIAGAVAVVFVVAYTISRLVEQPGIRLGKEITKRHRSRSTE